MNIGINETHDPARRSWVAAANAPGADFPIQNLPFGIFRRRSGGPPGVGVAIGESILDLAASRQAGLFTGRAEQAASMGGDDSLNRLMALGSAGWSALRKRLGELLEAGNAEIQGRPEREKGLLVPMSEADMLLPASIGDYTDFYASIHHATTVGGFFRPEQPLLPNYKYIPIGYHGRASSIVVSGTAVRRPRGQSKNDSSPEPAFGPSKVLDYETEAGFFVGPGNPLGEAIGIAAAEDHLFGLCLLNDWSARDIQKWEYQPLGPFLAKSFATSISPWVVTMEALRPFRVPAFRRADGDPRPLPHLDLQGGEERGGINLEIEVCLSTPAMRARGEPPFRLSRSNIRDLYWTHAQMLAHHASNGCNLRPGDLLGTGTVSGPTRDAEGCLLELTRQGKQPIVLPDGEERRFLADGDEVIMRGRCTADGFVPIGLGQCRGQILPALD